MYVELMSNPKVFAEKNLMNLTKGVIFMNEIWDFLNRFLSFKYDFHLTEEMQAFLKYIYYDKWYIIDLFIVGIHYLFNAALIFPLIVFTFIN